MSNVLNIAERPGRDTRLLEQARDASVSPLVAMHTLSRTNIALGIRIPPDTRRKRNRPFWMPLRPRCLETQTAPQRFLVSGSWLKRGREEAMANHVAGRGHAARVTFLRGATAEGRLPGASRKWSG